MERWPALLLFVGLGIGLYFAVDRQTTILETTALIHHTSHHKLHSQFHTCKDHEPQFEWAEPMATLAPDQARRFLKEAPLPHLYIRDTKDSHHCHCRRKGQPGCQRRSASRSSCATRR
jgi:hypothetical protein